MAPRRTLHRYFGIALLCVGNAAAAQVPAAPPPEATIPLQGALWSLAAGAASGRQGLAGFLSGGSQRRLVSMELRLSRAEASAEIFPFGSPENDRGPIRALELAVLAGVGKRTARTLSAARVGIGLVSRTQCMQGCGFFAAGPPDDETLRTIGLAYAMESGLLLGGSRTFGLAAIVFGNANSAHSFVSGGGRVSIGRWK